MSASPSRALTAPYVDEREAKFLPDELAAHAVWAVASQHLVPEVDVAHQAYTRTTYFDTAELTFYRSRGRRLRVREYAQLAPGGAQPVHGRCCFVELKQSADGHRTKTRLAVRSDQVAAALATMSDAPLAACVATLYRRRALVDAAGTLRLTLDDRILLCRPRPLDSAFDDLRPGDVLAEGPPFVLEYKTWGAPPAWLAHALAGLDEAIGFTKFVLGMDAVAAAHGLDRSLLGVEACPGSSRSRCRGSSCR